ncbi:unnamed protein product [Rotaria sp. Silwood1]|nr:unnamed protein product [Rotaria sp. Silwood1]CAF4760166.1 unnamed protein product [Rotaria sp. Silwood1]
MKLIIPGMFFLMFGMALFVVANASDDVDGAFKILQKFADFTVGKEEQPSEIDSAAGPMNDYTLIPKTYLVQFDQRARITNFEQLIIDFLGRSRGIPRSAITMRQTISTSLFSGASFSVNFEHSIKAIESIPDVISVYPVYSVPGPKPFTNYVSSGQKNNNQEAPAIAHDLTGVAQIHDQMKNFGKGVRIAVIDSGIDYFHPALGGCFGSQCKVAFGHDFVGDRFSASNPIPVSDDDPIDDCSASSHGTHVAGIIAANATEISQIGFMPIVPFLGVAPQATLGAC